MNHNIVEGNITSVAATTHTRKENGRDRCARAPTCTLPAIALGPRLGPHNGARIDMEAEGANRRTIHVVPPINLLHQSRVYTSEAKIKDVPLRTWTAPRGRRLCEHVKCARVSKIWPRVT